MTSAQIETQANRGNIAGSDFDVKFCFRREVVPMFMLDVGEATWRKKVDSLTVAPGDQHLNLPDAFYKMIAIITASSAASAVGSGGAWGGAPFGVPVFGGGSGVTEAAESFLTKHKMTYLGESGLAMATLNLNTTPGAPSGYWITENDSGELKAIRFDCPSDASYTLPYVYLSHPYFSDDTTSVNMNQFIPEPLQFPLIPLLRAQIVLDRYGVDDPRYPREMEKYAMRIEMIRDSHSDLAPMGMIAHIVD